MEIKNAILHIIKNDGNPSVYSESELDIDSEICELFINKHVKKLMNNAAVREATFKVESPVYQCLQGYLNRDITFKDMSTNLAERFDGFLNLHVDIPPADLLVVRFDLKMEQFVALFKLNYNECYSHETGGEGNSIVKYSTVLPFGSGKVEEACLIQLSPMMINLIEKPHPVNGEMAYYFSEIFLECEATLSRKETAQIISEVANEFVQEYYENNVVTHAMIKSAMTEEADDTDGTVSMESVAGRVFEETEARQNFVHTMREAGIVEDVELGAKFVKQQFGTHRLKAENGVEIRFPAEMADDEGQMTVERHSDGSVTIVFKNLRVQV